MSLAKQRVRFEVGPGLQQARSLSNNSIAAGLAVLSCVCNQEGARDFCVVSDCGRQGFEPGVMGLITNFVQ